MFLPDAVIAVVAACAARPCNDTPNGGFWIAWLTILAGVPTLVALVVGRTRRGRRRREERERARAERLLRGP